MDIPTDTKQWFNALIIAIVYWYRIIIILYNIYRYIFIELSRVHGYKTYDPNK